MIIFALILWGIGRIAYSKAVKEDYVPKKSALFALHHITFLMALVTVKDIVMPALSILSPFAAQAFHFIVAATIAIALYFTFGYVLYGFLALIGKEDLVKSFHIFKR